MAVPIELARAKAAVLYQPPSDIGLLLEPGPLVTPTSSLISSDHFLDQLSVVEEILCAQDKLNQLKIRSERRKLQSEWSNPLGQDLVRSLTNLVNTKHVLFL